MDSPTMVQRTKLQSKKTILLIFGYALLTWLWAWEAFGRHSSYSRPLEFGFLGAVVAIAFTSLWWLLSILNQASLPARPRERGASCFSACLLFLIFLPEYAIGHHVPLARSYALLALAGILFAAFAYIFLFRRPGQNETCSRHKSGVVATLLVFLIVYYLLCNYLSIRKYLNFGYVGQDLAYFSQCFYTTTHGHFFYSNLLQDLLYSKPVFSDFAGHNSVIMAIFVPFYYAYPSPVTLLVLRNTFVVLCAWPLYLLARRRYSREVSALLCAAFLFFPTILYQNVFDFYPLSLAAFFLLWVFYFFDKNRFRPFLVFLLLTLFVREDLVFAIFGIGLLALWWRYSTKWVVAPLLISIAWAIFSFKAVIPHFLHGASYMESVCFAHVGQTPRELAQNVLSHPVQTLFIRGNLIYLKQLLTPLAGVFVLGSPVPLLAIPYLGINLLAGGGPCITTDLFAQYSVIPVVFLFLGFVVSLGKQSRFISKGTLGESEIQLAMVVFVLVLSIGCSAFLTEEAQFREFAYKPWQREARQVALSIPVEAAVAAPRYMLPMLANRMSLYQTHRLLDYHEANPDYVIMDHNWNRIDAAQRWMIEYQSLAARLQDSAHYQVVYNSPEYTVYRQVGSSEIRFQGKEPRSKR